MTTIKDWQETLDSLVEKYNTTTFIADDPISIAHQFTIKEDIEIAGFLAASLAWGNRKAILKSSQQLITWMDYQPYDFIASATDADLKPFQKFVYRTFNGSDCITFIKALQNIYKNNGGLEKVFSDGYKTDDTIKSAISNFRAVFFKQEHLARTQKHIANPMKKSAAKRINMFLRWMVRSDNAGVDFGLWNTISPKHLMIPLDVHSGKVARYFGLLSRKQNDWQAVEELTQNLSTFDFNDPVKYDFALFGVGVNKHL